MQPIANTPTISRRSSLGHNDTQSKRSIPPDAGDAGGATRRTSRARPAGATLPAHSPGRAQAATPFPSLRPSGLRSRASVPPSLVRNLGLRPHTSGLRPGPDTRYAQLRCTAPANGHDKAAQTPQERRLRRSPSPPLPVAPRAYT
jgi:hypothetical protein